MATNSVVASCPVPEPVAMRTTTVYHPDTDQEFVYTLSPDQAVIAAYEQHTCHNYNTWRYRDPAGYNGYRRTRYGHECNGYWAKA